ncbi:MAG: PAS domain S-box protein [Actinobacteria bacterium]|nr:MAG: PAS domain S-box protein [Actinomycetota bacterium]
MVKTKGSGAVDLAERLRATLDSLLDPHVVLTAVRDDSGEIVDFEFTDANAAACEYNGLPYEELVGMRLLDLLPGHQRMGLLEQYKRVIETGEPLVLDDYVYPVEFLDGKETHFDIRGVALGDSMVYTWRDVTERHRRIQALADAEREYRNLAEATTDMAYRTDASGAILWVSPSVTRVLGWTSDELLGRTAADLVPPEEFASHAEHRAQAYSGEWVPDGEQERVFHILRKEGGTVPMVAVVSRDLGADGEWTGGLLVGLRDVTDVLRQEEIAAAERAKAERLQLSIDRAAVGMAITDQRGAFEHVNPALAKMLRYSQEELAGMSFDQVTHPDDIDASRAMMMRFLDSDVDQMSLRKRYVNALGEILWVDLSVAAARRDDGSVDHFIAQLVDVTAEVEYSDALETTVRRFRQLAENASDIVYEMDTDWTIRWISPSVQNVLGWDPEHLVGTPAPSIIAPGQEELLAERGAQMRSGYSVGGENLAYLTASGQTRWFSAMAHPMTGEDDVVTGVIVGLRDVTSEIEAREALSKVQQRLRLAVDAAPNGLVITDESDVLVDVNRQFCELIGMSEDDLVARKLGRILEQVQAGPCGEESPHEHRVVLADEPAWIEHDVREVSGHADDEVYFVHLFSDVTREREVREELTHMATHDTLTGVANRRWFIERLQRLARADNAGSTGVGVLFCDLDRLKEINDEHGHLAGDTVLTAVASRLAAAVRGSDDVGRLGGDEFVVLLDGVGSIEDLRAVAEKIRERVSHGVIIDGRPIEVTISVGAALLMPGEKTRTVLQRADNALLVAKGEGRNRVVVAEALPARNGEGQ